MCNYPHFLVKFFKICNNHKDIKNATSPLDYTEVVIMCENFPQSIVNNIF